ncbi:6-carboxytetrahydropterin synthase QueD [Natranaerobius trueperi]|uniref:6-carboxy-5,6,7,8-tetrahydropterin synthase n=1 Tax=Natranaerobius trueperi TaxID=759412 RepID=A0A226BVE9_9FIRM|nr:6-carboxytetrahydropterin synthase QueD [Natranaerobius trueperi]OWZ83018.1 6-carboxytetrahydropterin synthase QueD [Natranaerobius trueperi]
MFTLQSEFSFDAAHNLEGHEGKCKNLHGHRWRVIVQVSEEKLKEEGSERDMVVDFSILKKDLKQLSDMFDHKVIVEGKELKVEEEQITLPFRPTAERLSQFIYKKLQEKEYNVSQVTVYETPNNAVIYSE